MICDFCKYNDEGQELKFSKVDMYNGKKIKNMWQKNGEKLDPVSAYICPKCNVEKWNKTTN